MCSVQCSPRQGVAFALLQGSCRRVSVAAFWLHAGLQPVGLPFDLQVCCGWASATVRVHLRLRLRLRHPSHHSRSRSRSRSHSRIEHENEDENEDEDEIAAFYILQSTRARTPGPRLCASPPRPRGRPVDDAVDEPEGDVVQLGDRVWPRLREIRVADGVTALEVVFEFLLEGLALVAAALRYGRGPVLVLVLVVAV